MQRGLFILRSTVLPALDKEGTNANSDFFREIDQRAGQSHEQGALRVYEAFFGTDHIHLGRSPDSKHYDIDNGRHRIKVAQELGWTHIPVKK